MGGAEDARPLRYVFDEGHHIFDAADAAFSAALCGAETAELRRWLGEVHGVSASDGLMHGTLARLGLTHKKRRCMPPNRSARTLRLRVLSGRSSSPA